MFLVICIVSWLTMGYLTSRLALKKGRDGGVWFFLGVVFGLLALLILAFLPPKRVLAVASAPSMPAASPQLQEETPPSTTLWYYLNKERQQQGPMSLYALQEAWADDLMTDQTYVWNETMENWEKLEALPETLARIRRASE